MRRELCSLAEVVAIMFLLPVFWEAVGEVKDHHFVPFLSILFANLRSHLAILKATGFSGTDVKWIFLVIALSIGFFGGLAGLLFGFLLSVVIDQVPFVTASLPTIKTYPINYNPIFYGIATGFSLITTYLAGWFPSRKASKADPVIIIRGK